MRIGIFGDTGVSGVAAVIGSVREAAEHRTRELLRSMVPS
jgi:hypothetical protein